MITEQFRIISILTGSSLTINQIAKLLKKSYAFTNKHVHELIEENLIKKQVVGSAILCSLNYRNKKAMAALTYNSILASRETDSGGEIVYSLNGKRFTTSYDDIKITELDLSKIKIHKGHELFWKKAGEAL